MIIIQELEKIKKNINKKLMLGKQDDTLETKIYLKLNLNTFVFI